MQAPRVTQAWFVICASRELRGAPVHRSLWGTPIVLFRDGEGRAGALLDRCAHRNVPLSLGRVVKGRLTCGYHGWRYDVSGNRREVPGLCGDSQFLKRAVPAFAVREQDGLVWVYATPGVDPSVAPFRLPAPEKGTTVVRRTVEMEAPLHAVLENALDVPHTAFLHRGLFRGTGRSRRIRVKVSRTDSGVQAEFIGEPRPEGWAAWILSPSGGIVTHFDRFILPSIAQVEYRLGSETHFIVTAMCTPLEEFRTRIFSVFRFRTRFPGWLVKLALTPLAERIFKQDAFIVKAQSDAVRRFGGERYVSTPVDILGLQIARLLRLAHSSPEPLTMKDADRDRETEWERVVEMDV